MGAPEDFFKFLDQGLSPWHVCSLLRDTLVSAGFIELFEDQAWNLNPGSGYFTVRNNTSLIAFRTPKLSTESPKRLFRLAGAHTDSPCLRLRNQGILVSNGLVFLQTEVYGSPIISTWLDRDLCIAGSIIVREKNNLVQKTVVLSNLKVLIPNLAIHLNRDINKGIEYNQHTHLRALLPLAEPSIDPKRPVLSLCEHVLGLETGQVVEAELCLAPAQKAVFLDDTRKLFMSPRIDNLAGCYAIAQSLLQVEATNAYQIAAFFDHEEIGSSSRAGASSSFLTSLLTRLSKLGGFNLDSYEMTLASASMLSIDAAHAVHPSWTEKHDTSYAPSLGSGFCIKSNVNHRYATEILNKARITEKWKEQNLKMQEFKNKADAGCGSTIGPISEALSGIQTLDAGIPILAMHSAVETAHYGDQIAMQKACEIHWRME